MFRHGISPLGPISSVTSLTCSKRAMANHNPVFRSRDLSQPIRDEYYLFKALPVPDREHEEYGVRVTKADLKRKK